MEENEIITILKKKGSSWFDTEIRILDKRFKSLLKTIKLTRFDLPGFPHNKDLVLWELSLLPVSEGEIDVDFWVFEILLGDIQTKVDDWEVHHNRG